MPEIRLHWERFSNRLEARYKNRNLDLIHVYHQRWPVLRRNNKTNPTGGWDPKKIHAFAKDSILKSGDFWCRAVFRGSRFSPNTFNESKDHPKTRSCWVVIHFIISFGFLDRPLPSTNIKKQDDSFVMKASDFPIDIWIGLQQDAIISKHDLILFFFYHVFRSSQTSINFKCKYVLY